MPPYQSDFRMGDRNLILLAGPPEAWAELATALAAQGVGVHRASTPAEVRAQLQTYPIDLAVVAPELWAPGRFRVPVVVHPVRGPLEDRLTVLNGGADDAVPESATGRELLARMTALLRRRGAQP